MSHSNVGPPYITHLNVLFYPKTIDRWFYFTQYSNGRIIVTRILGWPIFWLKNNLNKDQHRIHGQGLSESDRAVFSKTR